MFFDGNDEDDGGGFSIGMPTSSGLDVWMMLFILLQTKGILG